MSAGLREGLEPYQGHSLPIGIACRVRELLVRRLVATRLLGANRPDPALMCKGDASFHLDSG
jgi:hypothetical protein